MNNDTIRLVIGGDVVPTQTNFCEFENGDVLELIGADLVEELANADLCAFNLETPLSDEITPIMKCGPNLSAPTACVKGLSRLNPGVYSLANNHIFDQGQLGLKTTCQALRSENVDYFGVGEGIDEARRPYIYKKGAASVGLYACVEHEFSQATATDSGANPYDSLKTPADVATLKEKCDHVVVLYHGGKEHYRYPSPQLQTTCRTLIEAGADLVVCQHSHCIGCEEKWLNGTIVYGQGNFLFDLSDDECWRTGLLIRADFDQAVRITYVPLVKDGSRVRAAREEQADKIIKDFLKRSEQIRSDGFVEDEYQRLAQRTIDDYLNGFIPWIRNPFFRAINRISGYRLVRNCTSSKQLLAELNHIECEAHRELMITGLKELIKQKSV